MIVGWGFQWHVGKFILEGKMLYFEKAELEAWLRQNPVKTQAQIEQEAQKYILNRPLKK